MCRLRRRTTRRARKSKAHTITIPAIVPVESPLWLLALLLIPPVLLPSPEPELGGVEFPAPPAPPKLDVEVAVDPGIF
jgi:hypothetical protein